VVSNLAGKTVGVPRGLLRYLVLKMLGEKPMSGAEIAQQIEQQTGDRWKPSPGSIYPLLLWLHKNGFTSESLKNESAIKKYTLTSEGRAFFKEQVMLGQSFLEKMRCLVPMFIEGFQFDTSGVNLHSANESAIRLLETFIELDSRKNKLTRENVADIAKILDESNIKLTSIIQRIDGTSKQHSD
jgi:DNA-binding PadR family transcriptional regulator